MKSNIVLLPGLASNDQLWQEQTNALSSNFNVTVINVFGVDTLEALVAKVLRHSPRQFHLVGHSMGGWLALEIAKQYAERLLSLCLINTSAMSDTKEKQDFRKDLIKKAVAGRYEEVIDVLVQLFVYQKQHRATVAAMMKTVGPVEFIRQETILLNRKPVNVQESSKTPSLIITSQYDEVFSWKHTQHLKKQLKYTQHTVINDCGHMSPIEQPLAVCSILKEWYDAIG